MTLYFASGSSRAADIRGFAAVGHPIGIAAPELSPAAELELVALANQARAARRAPLPLFVDSGAFSEVMFSADGVTVAKPITDAAWRTRLALYRRLAIAFGPSVHLVAPDRIGDQEETLRRLQRYAPELRELRELGAQLLVPIQKGRRSQAAFVRDVARALGFDDFVHAIPSKKKATTMGELESYLRDVRPARLHFLGLGIKSRSFEQVSALVRRYCPGATTSFDSNLIAANVGRGSKPRLLTRCRDEARRIIANGRTPIASAQELGIILAFGDRFAVDGAIYMEAA